MQADDFKTLDFYVDRCPSCGAELDDEDDDCPACGAYLGDNIADDDLFVDDADWNDDIDF